VGGSQAASVPGGFRRTLSAEWPFLLGCALACALLLRPDVQFFGAPCGSDWSTYLDNAACLWHPDWPELHFQDWRKPLHAALVGLLGEGLGYVRAAQWISLGATALTVLGAGLLGRALGDRGTGAMAAVCMALLPSLEQSARWVNLYPLQAGLGALALGLAAACLRWPRWGLGALAGLAGGLTLAADLRGVGVLALVLATVAAAAWIARPRGRGLAVLGAALLATLATVTLDRGLQAHTGQATRALSSQLSIQTEVSIGPNLPPAVREACAATQASGGAVDRGTCARALLPHNWRELTASETLPPAGWLLLLPVALLPARWGRRSSLGTALILGGSLAIMLLGMGLVAYPERYALLQLVALVVLLPLAWQRLAERVPLPERWRALPTVVATLATAAMALTIWPGLAPLNRQPWGYCREAGTPTQELHLDRMAVIGWTREHAAPQDLLLDCSDSALRTLALPERLRLEMAPLQSDRCAGWVTQPPPVEGRVRMLTMMLPGGQPVMAGTHMLDLQAQGWRRIALPELRGHGQGQLLLWERGERHAQ
jgi:hypothetical protein